MEIFTNYLLLITSLNKLILINLNKREKVIDSFLNINSSTISPTKISSVKFLDLDRIIIHIDTYNIFKNSNVKTILLYDRKLDEMIKLSNSEEMENVIVNTIKSHHNIKSHYNEFINNQTVIQGGVNLFKNSDNSFENNKINSDLFTLEEKLIVNSSLNQKNEFLIFFRKFIQCVIKNSMYYRLIDFFFYIYKLNNKDYFSFLVGGSDGEKGMEILNEIIKEVIYDQDNIPSDVKEFLKSILYES
jgi:hypothetical protein